MPTYRYVYQVVVPKSLAPKELVAIYEGGNAKVLPPWDPMVTLLFLRKSSSDVCIFREPWHKCQLVANHHYRIKLCCTRLSLNSSHVSCRFPFYGSSEIYKFEAKM